MCSSLQLSQIIDQLTENKYSRECALKLLEKEGLLPKNMIPKVKEEKPVSRFASQAAQDAADATMLDFSDCKGTSKNGKITVFGGEQTRPNIHIQDLANVYRHFLSHPGLASGCYNAGFENIKIREIAERVQKQTGAEIVITESNDPRSYRQDSSKLLATGFKPQFSVQDAIEQITKAYRNDDLPDGEHCYTVKWMKHLQLEASS